MTDTRDRIIDSAASLFAERGFRQTSIDDVIERARLSGKSHFYHYFRSKDQLGLEVVSRQCDAFDRRRSEILRAPSREPLDRIERLIDLVLAPEGGGKPALESPFGGLALEMAAEHAGIRDRRRAALRTWASELDAVLLEARPQLRDGADAARLSRFVIASVEGALMLFRVSPDGELLRGVSEELKRYLGAQRRAPAGER